MIVTQPIFVKLSCTGGSASEIASHPPHPLITMGVAIARPTRIMANWIRSEIWSAIIPPNVV